MDEIIRTWSTGDSSYTYSLLGMAIKGCTWSTLKEQCDTILHKLSSNIKDHVSSCQLSGAVSCVEILLRRLSIDKGTPQSSGLNKLIRSLISHHLSSILCQCIVLHCLSLVISLYPGSCKDYQSVLMKWCKESLFSSNTSLVKESSCLIQSLTYSIGSKPSTSDDKQFFTSLLHSIQYILNILTAAKNELDPSLLLLPDNLSSYRGKEKEELLVRCVGGLSRLVQTCLLVDTGRPFHVPLHDLLSVIWRLMDEGGREGGGEYSSSYNKSVLFRVSWQLLLATIHSCGTSLFPSSHPIEAAIVKALHQTPPTYITVLICKCINEWVCLRGIAPPQFIEDVLTRLCLVIHHQLQATVDYKCKEIICAGNDVILSLYVKTLYLLCTNNVHTLSVTIIKFINSLCQRIECSSYSVDVSHLSLYIKCSIMEYPHTNDINQMDEIVTDSTPIDNNPSFAFQSSLPSSTKPLPTSSTKPLPTSTGTKPLPTASTKPLPTSTTKPLLTSTTKPLPTSTVTKSLSTPTKPLITSTSTKPLPNPTNKPFPTYSTKPLPTSSTKPLPTSTSTKQLPTSTGTKPLPTTLNVEDQVEQMEVTSIDKESLPSQLNKRRIQNRKTNVVASQLTPNKSNDRPGDGVVAVVDSDDDELDVDALLLTSFDHS